MAVVLAPVLRSCARDPTGCFLLMFSPFLPSSMLDGMCFVQPRPPPPALLLANALPLPQPLTMMGFRGFDV